MTSRREHPRNATGAPPAHRASRTTHHRSASHSANTDVRCDDAYLDGLFTYCLSVMCEHEAALAALGETLTLADRQRARGRAPEDERDHRPWLYALARWVCSRRLADQKAALAAAGTAVTERVSAPASPAASGAEPLSAETRARRRRELAALAWPEAAGISPEQREALELSVRHRLSPAQIAAVLSLSTAAAEDLLLNASCEVERTRAALGVIESGGCAAVARLAGEEQLLLGTALRRELVRHVDECPQCRRAAERAMAGVSWPGTAPASATLAVVPAPRPAVEAAVVLARRARAQRVPRFDRAGFPVCTNERVARRDRLRGRALTSTVIAAVLAAPVVALWAAYRGSPVTGEPQADRSVTASDAPDGPTGGAGGGGLPPGFDGRRTLPAEGEDNSRQAGRTGSRAREADGGGRTEPSRTGAPKPPAQRRSYAAPPSADRPSAPAPVPDPSASASPPPSPAPSGTPTRPPSPTGSPTPSDTPTPSRPADPSDSPS
ncbi:hypothetical protein [Streptomyces sp. 3N207]|uniref:hypothetical protein n=1 Tax=Streptomyces sp. 3N207 TaxID=3457417 RepID=UPI003FCF4D39